MVREYMKQKKRKNCELVNEKDRNIKEKEEKKMTGGCMKALKQKQYLRKEEIDFYIKMDDKYSL